MPKRSAGLLIFRETSNGTEVMLVHPGGPFWAKKDAGAWSIPKGELAADEEPLAAARREFTEETGFTPEGEMIPLQPLRQPSGKVVHAWAMKGDFEPARLRSNTFTMEWPPRSGQQQEFPEIDHVAWFTLGAARSKIVKGQVGFLDQLEAMLGPAPEAAGSM